MRRELAALAALVVGTFLALALLPWSLTGALGSGIGSALWRLLGIGAVAVPLLGLAVALAVFGRLGGLSPVRAAALTAGMGLVIPFALGVIGRVRPEAFDPSLTDWAISARLVGLVPGFLSHYVIDLVGVAGGLLTAVLALSAVTFTTIGWHPFARLRAAARLDEAPSANAEEPETHPRRRTSSRRAREDAPAATAPVAVVLGNEELVGEPEPMAGSEAGDGVPGRRRTARAVRGGPGTDLIPPIDLLALPPAEAGDVGEAQLDHLGETLVDTLGTFKVEGTIVGRTTGPVVTQFEVAPGPGVKVGRIAALADDLALAMRAQSIRIVAPIPGKAAVGVEIPNPRARLVTARELIDGEEWRSSRLTLPVALGRDLQGRAVIADLGKMPHLLVAGATGSGKSVCVNTLITSLVYRHTPEQLRFLLIDPKMVELSMYNVLPHMRHPVVTNNHKAATALKWAVHEMERRYRLLHANHARNISDFNKKVRDGKPLVIPREDAADGAADDGSPTVYSGGALPYIVLIVDELADLIMTVQSEVEPPLALLAQKARAIGIHLVLATQRPSVNVITGLIKANFPCRIAFRVASKVDSRTILDQNGAETLLGNGDMLFLPPGRSEPVRIQGCYIGTEETERLMRWYEEQRAAARVEPDIMEQMAALEEAEAAEGSPGGGETVGERDPLFHQAAEVCIQHQLGSTSLLQRRLSIGYGRAARIIDQLERAGVLGPANGSKPRDVLVGLGEIDGM